MNEDKIKISRRTFAVQSGLAGLLALMGFRGIKGAPPPTVFDKTPLSDKFLTQLPKMMEFAGVPGVTIVEVKNGKVSWQSDFGVKNADTKEPVTIETVFPAASLSKPVFTYAVLLLHDEGLIDLDRPLINYLPGEIAPNEPRVKAITARHVLSHSTGLQNWRFRANDELKLAFTPGEKFSYSGEGFFYLQRVVEKITGKGLDEFMRERIFEPLGMKNSSYIWLPQYEKHAAMSHNYRGKAVPPFGADHIPKLLELAEKWNKPLNAWRYEDYERAMPSVDANLPALPNFILLNAAASMKTTSTDFARFLMHLLNSSDRKNAVKKETLAEMLKTQTKINSAISWGLGIGLENYGGHSYFWHWGDNGTYKAFVIGEPSKKWGMAIFTNGSNGHRIWERIVREATGRDHPSFLWI